MSQSILLKKFQISHNRSLDGVLDNLNSKYDVVGGLGVVGEIADDSGEGGAGKAAILPGAKRGDDGSRKTKVEVRCKQVSEWSAASERSERSYVQFMVGQHSGKPNAADKGGFRGSSPTQF